MAKRGLDVAGARELIKTRCAHEGWTLCIGAGTSLRADGGRPSPFPLWGALVERLVRRVDPAFALEIGRSSLASFNLDALIQAARNHLGGSDEHFSEVLAEVLYADLRAGLGADWPRAARCLAALRPGDCTREDWAAFRAQVDAAFPSLTALGLADAVAEVAATPLAPRAIVSFNAEPLFHALLNAACAARSATAGPGPQRFDRVTRSVSPRGHDRIPYVFCHGLLPIPGSGASKPTRTTALDKLVFSEAEYLQLANSSFAWQSSVFLSACTTTTTFFVGLSMTDPNMRRWLAWTHDNRERELAEAEGYVGDSTSHFWITRAPATREERTWTELSMAHLGVRLLWVERWTDVVPLVRQMLGL